MGATEADRYLEDSDIFFGQDTKAAVVLFFQLTQ